MPRYLVVPKACYLPKICDNGTYIACNDDLVDDNEKPVDLSDVAVRKNCRPCAPWTR